MNFEVVPIDDLETIIIECLVNRQQIKYDIIDGTFVIRFASEKDAASFFELVESLYVHTDVAKIQGTDEFEAWLAEHGTELGI